MLRCRCFILLAAVVAGDVRADDPPKSDDALEKYKKLTDEVDRAYNAGNFAEAAKKQQQVLELVRSLVPASKYPNGHAKLADALNDLGVMYYSAGRLEAALTPYQQALAMRQKLYPKSEFPNGHADLALSYNTIGMLYSAMGKYDLALDHLQQGLAMRQRLFPDGNADVATSSNNIGLLLRSMNRLDEALQYLEKAYVIRQKIYPASKFPNGHPHLASSLNNIALVRESLGKFDDALSNYEQSLAMRRKLYPESRFPDGHPDLSVSLNNIGSLFSGIGQFEKALDYYQQALAIDSKFFGAARYPNGHPNLATTYFNFGFVLKHMGRFDEAMARYESALAMRRKLYPATRYPDGHPDVAACLNNIGLLQEDLGRIDLALQSHEQSLAMRQKIFPRDKFPNGHPELADSLAHMGALLHSMHRDEIALGYFDQALAMTKRVYSTGFPEGHPELAKRLANHAVFVREMDKLDAAIAYAEEAYAMFRRVYPPTRFPDGHIDLAWSARVLGNMYAKKGRLNDAQKAVEESAAVCRRLYPTSKYPNGHNELFAVLNNLGALSLLQGKPVDAIRHGEAAQKMLERLFPGQRYPLGHPDMVIVLCNIAVAKATLGRNDEALTLLDRAMRMAEQLSIRDLTYASEADALAESERQLKHLYFLLSLSRGNAKRNVADYSLVWSIKAATFRLLSLRHAAARINMADPKGDARIRSKWDELVSVRHRLSQLIHTTAPDAKQRDEHLADLNERRDRLERELAELMPDLPLLRKREAESPAELARCLPAGAALVDFLRYTYSEFHEKERSRRTDSVHYLAFIVTPGREPVRVELGPAEAIDAAIKRWRNDIVNEDDRRSAAALRDLVWKPLAAQLPADTRTIYLAVDGDLARVPFVALDGDRPGSVLLEEFTIAVAPHGPYLLEKVKARSSADVAASDFFGMGSVDFGHSDGGKDLYLPLPGTEAELKQIGALTRPGQATILTGAACTPQRVAQELPKAAVAHLATHGFFDSAALVKERARFRDFLTGWQEQSESQGRIGVGRRSPLAYTGLVLANGNHSTDSIWTGETIVSLPLENLKLVTLSACETGLGDLTGGEGVQGLQRAFHLAGCSNVIASLWKVSDAATAALMAKFYHELWVNKKPPIEALREAQLTIYRHPERIPALAGNRGKPDFNKTIELKVEPRASANADAKRTPTKLWAAFVLSGVGK